MRTMELYGTLWMIGDKPLFTHPARENSEPMDVWEIVGAEDDGAGRRRVIALLPASLANTMSDDAAVTELFAGPIARDIANRELRWEYD